MGIHLYHCADTVLNYLEGKEVICKEQRERICGEHKEIMGKNILPAS